MHRSSLRPSRPSKRQRLSYYYPPDRLKKWACMKKICKKRMKVCPGFLKSIKLGFLGKKWFKGIGICEHVLRGCKRGDIEVIYERTFEGHGGIKTITIPETVKSIEIEAFAGCTNLKYLGRNKDVTFLLILCLERSQLLGYFPNIKKLLGQYTISSGMGSIKVITNGCFMRCLSLKRVKIPPTVREIDKNAFKSCKSLKKVTIPEGVKRIGHGAFSYCSSLL